MVETVSTARAGGAGTSSGTPRTAVLLHAALSALLPPGESGSIHAEDLTVGRHLSLRPALAWGQTEVAVAADITSRHRHELAALGVDFRRLPSAPPHDEVAQARQALAEGVRRTALSHVRLTHDERLALSFPASPELTDEARTIAGHHREPGTSAHLYPRSSLPGVLAFAARHAIAVPDEVRSVGKDELAAAPTDVPPTVRVRGDGDLEVVFPLRTPLVYAVRALPGRRWDAKTRSNVFPRRAAPAVVEFADGHGFNVQDEARAVARAEAASASPQVKFDDSEELVIVDCGYRPDLHAALTKANHGLSTWARDRSAYVLTAGVDAAAVLASIAQFDLRAADGARAVLSLWRAAQQRNRIESLAASGPRITLSSLGVDLRPEQHVAVSFITRNRRVVYADPPGSGRTVAALAALEAANAYPAVVVCPPTVTDQWLDEIGRVLPHRRGEVLAASRQRPAGGHRAPDVIVVSSATLATVAPAVRAARKRRVRHVPRYLWLGALRARAPQALVMDDGHLEHQARSDRARALQELAQDVAARAGVIVDLSSGDPVAAGRSAVIRQLALLGRTDHLGGSDVLAAQLTANPEAVRRRLRTAGVLLLRAATSLPAVPSLHVGPVLADRAVLHAEALEVYHQAEATVLSWLVERATTTAARLRASLGNPTVARAMRRDGHEYLERLRALRPLLEAAKRPATLRRVQDRLDAGEKVVVAAARRDAVDDLAKALDAGRVHSGRTAKEIRQDVDRFRHVGGPAAIVVALAEIPGHDLTAAHCAVQAEVGFTAGEVHRMAARLHRLGQTEPVTYEVVVVPNTLDDVLWQVLSVDPRTLSATADGKDYRDNRAAVAAEAAWLLACRALGVTPRPRELNVHHGTTR